MWSGEFASDFCFSIYTLNKIKCSNKPRVPKFFLWKVTKYSICRQRPKGNCASKEDMLIRSLVTIHTQHIHSKSFKAGTLYYKYWHYLTGQIKPLRRLNFVGPNVGTSGLFSSRSDDLMLFLSQTRFRHSSNSILLHYN